VAVVQHAVKQDKGRCSEDEEYVNVRILTEMTFDPKSRMFIKDEAEVTFGDLECLFT